MTTEERVLKLENAFSTLAQLAAESNERTSKLEQNGQTLERSIQLLLEIAQTQSSRIDDGDERQRQTDAHLDVLGQRMTELATAQARTERTVEQLGQAVTKLTSRVDHLSETVERYINGKGA